jgi:hypothetical protein
MSMHERFFLGALLSFALACGDETGPADVAAPAKLVLTTPPPASAQNHVVLVPQPVIQLQDASGAPVAQTGTIITAAITAGDGRLEGSSTATTDGSGAASFTDLSLGGPVGEKTLTFSAPGVAGATAILMLTAGSLTSMAAFAGNNQFSEAGTAVTTPPAVRATDVDGNGVSGVAVTFVVDSGGGVISGATRLTDEDGVASVQSWVLGSTPGSNTLVARAEGLAGPPVTFTATAIAVDPCRRTSSLPISLDQVVPGALQSGDCTFHGGQFHDFYQFALAAQQAVILSLQSDDFDPTVDLFSYVDQRDRGALNDTVNTSRNVRLKAILAPATYEAAASSVTVGATGDYLLGLSTTSATVDSCEIVFVVRGISTEQQLVATDCVDGSGQFHGDIFDLWLEAGERVTLTQSSTTVNPLVQVYREGSELVAQAGAVGTATVEFEADQTGPYYVVATSALKLQFGAYTLSITDPTAGTSGTATSTLDRSDRVFDGVVHGDWMITERMNGWSLSASSRQH